ncbi:hypothetical protein UNDYM_3168 [Undibacterium sp. YM2]|nr:hypothetical protein UNDYM_3168 [Undibacterium sp. YM2]
MHLQYTVIQFDHAIRKFSFAKTGAGMYGIHRAAIHFQSGADIVEIAIAPAPEIQLAYACCGFDIRSLSSVYS